MLAHIPQILEGEAERVKARERLEHVPQLVDLQALPPVGHREAPYPQVLHGDQVVPGHVDLGHAVEDGAPVALQLEEGRPDLGVEHDLVAKEQLALEGLAALLRLGQHLVDEVQVPGLVGGPPAASHSHPVQHRRVVVAAAGARLLLEAQHVHVRLLPGDDLADLLQAQLHALFGATMNSFGFCR